MTAADDAWAGDRVARWLRQAPHLERQLAPVSSLLFAAAALEPGEHVLDVGCGTGPTTRDAAALVGVSGRVTGLDIAADMLAAAATQPSAGAEIDWLETDVTSWAPPLAAYDIVMSRFGVMFFADPPAAVTNMALATKPGGRLAVAVWDRRGASPLFAVPYDATLAVLAARDVTFTAPPEDGGPFSWRDPAKATALLEGGGWHDVAIATHTLRLPFGGGLDPAAAAASAVDFGPTRVVLAEAGADDATRAAVEAAIATALAEHVDESGQVVLDASVRIVTARR